MPFTLRTLAAEELPTYQRMLDSSFLNDSKDEHLERWRDLFEHDRHHGVFEDDELIGAGGVQTRTMTLPGAGPQPVAAVTGVGVKPGHRRRGVLTQVMRAQLHGLHEEGREAFAALYRYLLNLDMVGELQFFTASDDPIPHLLADPRLALRGRNDSLWVRLVDVDRALVQRRYASDVDTVLEVADEFCPWNAGRLRLTVKAGEATVERVEDEPDVVLHVRALGAAFLGGTRLTGLARAQQVREVTPGAVNTLSHAFLGDREPHCPEVF